MVFSALTRPGLVSLTLLRWSGPRRVRGGACGGGGLVFGLRLASLLGSRRLASLCCLVAVRQDSRRQYAHKQPLDQPEDASYGFLLVTLYTVSA